MLSLSYLLGHVTSIDINIFCILHWIGQNIKQCTPFIKEEELCTFYLNSTFVGLRNDCRISYFLLKYHFRSTYQQQRLLFHVHSCLVICVDLRLEECDFIMNVLLRWKPALDPVPGYRLKIILLRFSKA